jgi:hypothetical protein
LPITAKPDSKKLFPKSGSAPLKPLPILSYNNFQTWKKAEKSGNPTDKNIY